jgi:hypothetical protein
MQESKQESIRGVFTTVTYVYGATRWLSKFPLFSLCQPARWLCLVPLAGARASRMAGWYMNLYCFANHLDKQRTCIRSTMASSLRHYTEDNILVLKKPSR